MKIPFYVFFSSLLLLLLLLLLFLNSNESNFMGREILSFFTPVWNVPSKWYTFFYFFFFASKQVCQIRKVVVRRIQSEKNGKCVLVNTKGALVSSQATKSTKFSTLDSTEQRAEKEWKSVLPRNATEVDRDRCLFFTGEKKPWSTSVCTQWQAFFSSSNTVCHCRRKSRGCDWYLFWRRRRHLFLLFFQPSIYFLLLFFSSTFFGDRLFFAFLCLCIALENLQRESERSLDTLFLIPKCW